MQPKLVVIIAGAVVVVAAAFAGGYFLSRQSQPAQQQAAQSPTTAPITQVPASGTTTQTPATEAASQGPSAEPATTQTSQAPSYYEPARKVRHRYHDYADREYESAPPPPPPPPPQQYAYANQPDPFQGQFSLFPMRHQGNGSIDAPLTFLSQTVWGEGREADLRISIVVPEPGPSDRGEFWREWGARDRVDLMPDVTRGTPVIVTGSAAAIVTIDPALLDLDTPATLLLRGADGLRVYRSRNVAPARGTSWDSPGVRWIFAVDEDFYRMLRDGADAVVVIRHRGRDMERDVQIPFSTSDFPATASAFEWQVRRRINDIAAEWQRSQQGGVSLQAAPANNNQPPPASRAPAAQVVNLTPPPPASATPMAPPAPPPAQVSAPAAMPAPPVAAPQAPSHAVSLQPTQTTVPAPKFQPSTPAPAAPMQTAPIQTREAETLVAGFHPPTDNCGPQLAYPAADPKDYLQDTQPQLTQADAAVAKAQAWVACRQQWLTSYQSAVDALRTSLAGVPLMKVQGGTTVVADLQSARRSVQEQTALQRRHAMVLARAHIMSERRNGQAPAGNTPQPNP